ncbi:DinB family protein [Nocardioides zeae]|uniref:DinB family protein n=1 Tax=Nocardioides imazamoxiresistens TaxID=3231893 RepID=A0ABU3PSZ7_9ACTN|nr:DinB family protein [Nocardioides zeae]MDT9592345.1 DinB family protein [Nocardioides zeae]
MTDQTSSATATDLSGYDLTGERADLLESLRQHRALFLRTVEGLTDDQARMTPTVSSLSLGGLVKHVAATEDEWARFVTQGPDAGLEMDWGSVDWSDPPAEVLAYQAQFVLGPDETLAGVLEEYARVAAATDALVASEDLDRRWPLPAAPWFAPGSTRSVRRTFLHVVAETAQHAGHADIIRESIDGARTMG